MLQTLLKTILNTASSIMEFADEVRHLDGLKANFSVSETEYFGICIFITTTKTTTNPTSGSKLSTAMLRTL